MARPPGVNGTELTPLMPNERTCVQSIVHLRGQTPVVERFRTEEEECDPLFSLGTVSDRCARQIGPVSTGPGTGAGLVAAGNAV